MVPANRLLHLMAWQLLILAIGDVPDLDKPLVTQGLDPNEQEWTTEQDRVNFTSNFDTA